MKPIINRIVRVTLSWNDADGWLVEVGKEFAPECGGGYQIFRESGGSHVHRALDVARSMVTLTPGQRTDVPRGWFDSRDFALMGGASPERATQVANVLTYGTVEGRGE